MGLFDKLFGGKKQEAAVAEAPLECPHSVLVPRWDSVQDMGIEEKATRYMCEACHQMFSREEATALQKSIAERLNASLQDLQESSAEAQNQGTKED